MYREAINYFYRAAVRNGHIMDDDTRKHLIREAKEHDFGHIQKVYDKWRTNGGKVDPSLGETLGGEVDLVTDKAIASVVYADTGNGTPDRDAALFMWQRIAAGKFDVEALAFLQTVAKAVVNAESYAETKTDMSPGHRLRELGVATGLGGKYDTYRDVRRELEIVAAFATEHGPREFVKSSGVKSLPGEFEKFSHFEGRKACIDYLKAHPEHWPKSWHTRDYAPGEKDFDDHLRNIEKSYP